jgi:hypothetical protein
MLPAKIVRLEAGCYQVLFEDGTSVGAVGVRKIFGMKKFRLLYLKQKGRPLRVDCTEGDWHVAVVRAMARGCGFIS